MTANHEVLEQRYRRLLRVYPGRYRRERGEEIVGTYMDCAAEDRKRPTLADVGDIAKAGLLQRLRYAPEGLPGGMRVAAAAALSVVTAVSFVFTLRVEMSPPAGGTEFDAFGAFQSPAVILWALWMAVGLSAAFLPGRVTRGLVFVPMAATLAYIPIAYLTYYASPPMFSVIPLAVFGALVLAWPKTPHWTMRVAPPVSLLLALGAFGITEPHRTYRTGDAVLDLPVIVLLVLGAMVIAGVVEYLTRRTTRTLWAASVLLLPAIWFATYSLAGTRMSAGYWNLAASGSYVTTAVKFGLMALAIPLAALAWSHWRAAKR